MAASGTAPTVDDALRAVELLRQGEFAPSILREDILLTYRGRAIRPKTAGQKRYVDAIRSNTVTFGIGPAGTGKTYLAMAMAVAALKRKDVNRIILTRPVVEAGENLGFLPGTLTEKVDLLHQAFVRRAVRHDRHGARPRPDRSRRDQKCPARVHARTHVQ